MRGAPISLFCSIVLAGSLTACGSPSTSGALNDCTDFDDETDPTAPRKIDWNISVATSTKRCMTITVGRTVAFEGDLVTHPLGPQGGDTPTPFTSVPTTGKVTFDAPGTFGFTCGVHPSMKGAIKVIR